MSVEPLQPTGPFIKRRDEWIECVFGDDRNSIASQLHWLLWDAASFRVINRGRFLAPGDDTGNPKVSGLLHGLLNQTFAASQAARIRRLTDKKSPGETRAVHSLTALITDLEEHAELLTRKAIFDAEGLPYDTSPIQEQEAEFKPGKIGTFGQAFAIPPEPGSHLWEERHSELDRLCGVTANERQPTDKISTEVFSDLKCFLDKACGPVEHYVNKYIAHAATAKSREWSDPALGTLTLERFKTAESALCRVANFVAVVVLGDSSIGPLAQPIYDYLTHLDVPLVTKDQYDELQAEWDKYDVETQAWANWGLNEFETECSKLPRTKT